MPYKKRPKNSKGKKKFFLLLLLLAIFAAGLLIIFYPRGERFLRGVTYNLSYPKVSHYSQVPRATIEQDFRMMKDAGIELIRLYGQPPEFVLDLAERYGMKVIETIVFPGDWTDFASTPQLKALKREAVRNINRDINRECVYAWSIWNDAPWTYGSGKGDAIRAYGFERVNEFLKEIYTAVKKRDPLRPVTAATLSINEDAKRLGTDFLDILGYNVYLGISDWRTGTYDASLAERMARDLESISRKYGKPVLITETGYSTFWKENTQEEAIAGQIWCAERHGLRGIIIFQWADDWSKRGSVNDHAEDVEENWGIVDGYRGPKDGYRAVRGQFRKNLFADAMRNSADYLDGGYFAQQKQALKRQWKEQPAAGKELDELQNELSLYPQNGDALRIMQEICDLFFKQNAYNQCAQFFREYLRDHPETPHKADVLYYTAFSQWSKLEYLAGRGDWHVYFAEKAENLESLLRTLRSSIELGAGKEVCVKALYLEWAIHNEMVDGNEEKALERLQEEIAAYAGARKDPSILLEYADKLNDDKETRVADALTRAYAAFLTNSETADEAIDDAYKKFMEFTEKGDFARARIFGDSYVSLLIRSLPPEDAAFKIFKLSSFYMDKRQFDSCVELCERLMREYPRCGLYDDAMYTIALAYKGKKVYTKAIKAFRDFISAFPESELAKSAVKDVLSVFTVYGKGTRAEKTVEFLKEIVALYPDKHLGIMSRYELASSLASLDRKDEAVKEYQAIIDSAPDSDYAGYSRNRIERLLNEK